MSLQACDEMLAMAMGADGCLSYDAFLRVLRDAPMAHYGGCPIAPPAA